jgi:hypothetical protein
LRAGFICSAIVNSQGENQHVIEKAALIGWFVECKPANLDEAIFSKKLLN